MARTPPANLLDLREHTIFKIGLSRQEQTRGITIGYAYGHATAVHHSTICPLLLGALAAYHVVVVDLMSGASCRSAGRPRSSGSNRAPEGVRCDLAARPPLTASVTRHHCRAPWLLVFLLSTRRFTSIVSIGGTGHLGSALPPPGLVRALFHGRVVDAGDYLLCAHTEVHDA
jgi:hypothetical protein